jgi:hypothetical protein
MAINIQAYTEKYFKIRDKKSNIVPLVFNTAQQRVYEAIKSQHEQGKPIRIIELKSRQVGGSTQGQALTTAITLTTPNTRSAVIAHKKASTKALFNMGKSFYEGLPEEIKPHKQYSNDRELVFDKINSYIVVETAGGKDILRGETMNNLHLSEVAFWGDNIDEQMLGLMQAVPDEPNTMIFIESTANGFNYFKDLCDDAMMGDNDFIFIFVPWCEMDEYSKTYTGFKLTDIEDNLKKQHNLTNDQLEWRRWAIKNRAKGDIRQFRQEYPITPEEAFLSTGDCVFDKDIIIDRIQKAPKPIRRGEFVYEKEFYSNGNIGINNIQFVESSDGYIKIYEEFKNGESYVIGGDTAGEGSDSFEAQGIHLTTGKQVFTFTHLNDEDYYVEQMYCLGKMYDWACIGIENNFSTYPTKQLEKLDYPNQFARRKEDTAGTGVTMQYGVKTTTITRPLFISGLKSIVNNHIELLNDKDTMRQMLTFIRNKKKSGNIKLEAISGKHDDKVMALGIAYYIRGEELV